MTIEIWYRRKKQHEDMVSVEVELDSSSDPAIWVEYAMKRGGFWDDDVFVLWANVTYVEVNPT